MQNTYRTITTEAENNINKKEVGRVSFDFGQMIIFINSTIVIDDRQYLLYCKIGIKNSS